MTLPTLQVPTVEDFPAMWAFLGSVFGEETQATDEAAEATVFEPERSLVVRDRDRVVACAGIFSRTLTVPGATVPVAGVTLVGVAATHRRRGLLTAMMTRQLHDVHETGAEAVAALWASESVIYQRFGYGSAVPRLRARGRTRDTGFRPEVPVATGTLRMVDAEAAREPLGQLYEASRRSRPGLLERTPRWADYRYRDPQHWRDGATARQYVLHESPDGTVDGAAAYRVKYQDQDGAPDGLVDVHDVLATDLAVEAALWRHLFDVDLMRQWRQYFHPLDSPLPHLLLDPRALRLEIVDSLWIRLVDVARALAARRYRTPVDVVLEVSDERCPWNAGRWRLSGDESGARCEPSSDPADLRLTSTELGAGYLGGPSLSTLAAAGRVTARSAAVLDRASIAFGWPVAPFCPEVF